MKGIASQIRYSRVYLVKVFLMASKGLGIGFILLPNCQVYGKEECALPVAPHLSLDQAIEIALKQHPEFCPATFVLELARNKSRKPNPSITHKSMGRVQGSCLIKNLIHVLVLMAESRILIL